MDANDTSYMDFLKIYFPNAANSIDTLQKTSPQGKTPEELEKSKAEIEAQINSKLNNSDYVSDYNAYLKIPAGLRSLYSGTRVPDDMMYAARNDEILTLMEWEKHPNLKQVEDVREEVRKDYGIPHGINAPTEVITSAAAMVLFAEALKAGYSEGASLALAQQRQHREGLLEEKAGILADPNLSESEKKLKLKDWLENKWLESKKDTINTIKEDRAKNQPEKHLIYLLNKFNRGKLSKDELEKFDDKIAELGLRISTEGRQDTLLQYLKDHPSILRHYKKPTLDKLATLVLDKMPEAEREQFLSQEIFQKHNIKGEMSDDAKAATAAKDTKTQAKALPKEATHSAEERRADMPALRRGGVQREA